MPPAPSAAGPLPLGLDSRSIGEFASELQRYQDYASWFGKFRDGDKSRLRVLLRIEMRFMGEAPAYDAQGAYHQILLELGVTHLRGLELLNWIFENYDLFRNRLRASEFPPYYSPANLLRVFEIWRDWPGRPR